MSIRRTIKAELYRLGLHASTRQVVDALKATGIHLGANSVQTVKIELLKETNARATNECLGNRMADLGTLPDDIDELIATVRTEANVPLDRLLADLRALIKSQKS